MASNCLHTPSPRSGCAVRTSPAATSVAASSGNGAHHGAHHGAHLAPPLPHARPSPATFAAHEVPSPAGRHPFGRSGFSAASSSLLASLGVPGAIVGAEHHDGVFPNAGAVENGRSGCGGGSGGGGGSGADTALEAATRDEAGWRIALAAVEVEPELARGGAALMYLHALERAALFTRAARSHALELRRAVRAQNGAQNGALRTALSDALGEALREAISDEGRHQR